MCKQRIQTVWMIPEMGVRRRLYRNLFIITIRPIAISMWNYYYYYYYILPFTIDSCDQNHITKRTVV